MIRQIAIARSAVRTRAAFASAAPAVIAQGQRWASTVHAPTTSSGEAGEVGVSTKLAPGEEIDPQLNGYPQLPYVSLQQREPFGWWDQQERKNFGEVVHEEEDALGMWGPDVHKISGGTAVLSLIAAFSGIAAFTYFLTATRVQRPAAPREYPYGGLEQELGGHKAARTETELDEE